MPDLIFKVRVVVFTMFSTGLSGWSLLSIDETDRLPLHAQSFNYVLLSTDLQGY